MWPICQIRIITTIKTSKFYPPSKKKVDRFWVLRPRPAASIKFQSKPRPCVICVCLRGVQQIFFVFLFVCFVCLRRVYPMLLVTLDCSFLIVPSVFSDVYLYQQISKSIFCQFNKRFLVLYWKPIIKCSFSKFLFELTCKLFVHNNHFPLASSARFLYCNFKWL